MSVVSKAFPGEFQVGFWFDGLVDFTPPKLSRFSLGIEKFNANQPEYSLNFDNHQQLDRLESCTDNNIHNVAQSFDSICRASSSC